MGNRKNSKQEQSTLLAFSFLFLVVAFSGSGSSAYAITSHTASGSHKDTSSPQAASGSHKDASTSQPSSASRQVASGSHKDASTSHPSTITRQAASGSHKDASPSQPSSTSRQDTSTSRTTSGSRQDASKQPAARPSPQDNSESHPASGSFQDTSVVTSQTTISGGNEIIQQTNAGVITGTFSGEYLTVVKMTVYPTGYAVYTATDTCTCTVSGRSGTLVFAETGVLTLVNGVYYLTSAATITHGSGQLSELKSAIALQGAVYTASGLTVGTYVGKISS